MRKITNIITNAFIAGNPLRQGNDEVRINGKITELRLHGHVIAERINGKLFICNCGYQTNVTKERLNGLPNVSIQQKKGVWYLNGKEWNGNRIEVK